ncbi:MAG: hypothetical protein KGZ43_00395, partial [Sulfuritalea sp.]|nr:hypothetical protein [Sulfuritalea sp.]
KPAPTGAAAAPAPAAPAGQAVRTENLFVVFHENGRLYAVSSPKDYLSFLATNELSFSRSRIAAGASGETVVFGIDRNEANNLNAPARSERLFDDKRDMAGPFYGEVFRNERFYAFNNWGAFRAFLATKELPFSFTEVGAGPKGETVVYVLDRESVKAGRPVGMIETFNALRK